MNNSSVEVRAAQHIMYELRASGPCHIGELRYAILDQVPGVTRETVGAITKEAVSFCLANNLIGYYDEEMPETYDVSDLRYNDLGDYVELTIDGVEF